MYLENYGVNLERTFSPSAEVSSSLLLCSFLSSPILVCRKWEELGRNMGGTWEEQSACADGLFWETVPVSDFQGQSYSFFLIGKGLSWKLVASVLNIDFLGTIQIIECGERQTVCKGAFTYLRFETIETNWDKWGDNWDLR